MKTFGFVNHNFKNGGFINLEYIEGNSLPIPICVIKSNNKNLMMEIEGHKSAPRFKNKWLIFPAVERE